MKAKGTALKIEEREILILAALNQNGTFLSNEGIGRRLGISTNEVNLIIHQACIKLGAQDRNEGILLALKRGEISLNDFLSEDELVKHFKLLGPEMLIKLVDISHQELNIPGGNKQTILTNRRQSDLQANEGGSSSTLPKTNITVLNQQERDLLILTALHPDGKLLTNQDIGQRLGMSGTRVNSLIHQACVKLGAHSRQRAIEIAVRQREIILTDIWPIDQISELFSALGPDVLKRIAKIVRRGQKFKYPVNKNSQNVIKGRTKDGILTSRERDAVILAGIGLVNKEIAESLGISPGSVRIFLNRACAKLGVNKRSEAFMLALKKREIGINDVFSLDDIIEYLAPLGADSIEEMARLLEQKLSNNNCKDTGG